MSQHEIHAVDGEDELDAVPGHDLRHQAGLEVEDLEADLAQGEERMEGGQAQPGQQILGRLPAQCYVAHRQTEGCNDTEDVGECQTEVEEQVQVGVEQVEVRHEGETVVGQLQEGDQPGGGGRVEAA